jgi:hypothetical protein
MDVKAINSMDVWIGFIWFTEGCVEHGDVFLDVIRKILWQVWSRGKLHTGFWWGNLRKRDHLEDLGTDRGKILKYIFN